MGFSNSWGDEMRKNGSTFVTAGSASALLGLLTAVASLLLASAGAANATTILTVTGNYTLTTSNVVGNKPNLGYQLNQSSFSEPITLGALASPLSFFSTGPTGSNSGCGNPVSSCNDTASENITLKMNFTEQGGATGSLTVTGTYVAKYSGSSLACATGSQGLSQTDCFYWYTGAWTNNNNVVDTVTLSNNDILNVTLYAAEDWTIYPKIGFNMPVGDTGHQGTTPLPAAFPLFASGLGLMGFLAKRRKRKDVAAVAA
jgi:hypothetical protein